MCLVADNGTFPSVGNKTTKKKSYPYWNKMIQPKRWLYKQAARPLEGNLAEEMRGARYKYHYTIRDMKTHEENL